jgi:nucleotide-binding universal stress UspA family protein
MPGRSHRGTVVVGVDGSAASKQALRWAARQAKLRGDKLRVVGTWEYPLKFGWAPPLPPEYNPSRETATMLHEVVDEVVATEGPVEIETVVSEGRPAPALIEAARDADLLVVGTRGHGELIGLLFDSVGERCVTHAPCPVVVVRGHGAN